MFCFFCILYRGPSDQFLCILYWGPQLTFFANYMGPLRSVSSHTIWGPLSDQFICLILFNYLISLFAHVGYNPIEQHNILTIHVNYINNNILEKRRRKKKYIITAKQVKRVLQLHYILYIME